MINNSNYYSSENALKYMSVSQFKAFSDCEARTVAEISGTYQRESSTAMLVGSYVDAWFEGTLDSFKENHPEIFLKNGSLKADFAQAETIIQRVSQDAEFMKYMSGEKQKIFTGSIAGVLFKGKLDSYHAGKCIVDLKVMRDFEPIWKNHKKQHFIEAWGYDIQGAVYQELVRQATGEKLPFVICAVTKEKTPDIAILSIPQERLDYCLSLVESDVKRFDEIKKGNIPSMRCEKCDFCKSTKVLSGAVEYETFTPSETCENAVLSVTRIGDISIPPSIETAITEPLTHENKHKKKSKKKKHKKIIIKL